MIVRSPRGCGVDSRWRARISGLAAVLLGCQGTPRSEDLDRLRAEAIRANDEIVARIPAQHEVGYSLTVSGQIRAHDATLDWSELERIGTARVTTIDIQNPDKKTPTAFRGALVRDLLDRFQPSAEVTEATMVAIDGFRATIKIADARAYRMLLAIEADGAPIPRTQGGPIYLVHPFSENGPELRAKYLDRFWAFYVTHVVIGTEQPRLEISQPVVSRAPSGTGRPSPAGFTEGRVLDRAALDRIATTRFDGTVGWKVDWPDNIVHLRGVALVDAIAEVGLIVPPHGRIVIRGKAPIHNDPDKPIVLAVDDLPRCRPLLAMRWGPDEAPIPARLGGPIALAIAPCGDAYGDRLWVTFVEQISVEPP